MKAAMAYRTKVALSALLAAGVLLSAGSTAAILSFPGLELPGVSALGIGADGAAAAAANHADPVAALEANRAALATAPMSAASWMRIAYIQSRNGRPLSPSSLDAIERSYTVAPMGPDISKWRLGFLFEHWSQLTPAIRTEATSELSSLVRARGEIFAVDEIRDPSGRLAAKMSSAVGQSKRNADFAALSVASTQHR